MIDRICNIKFAVIQTYRTISTGTVFVTGANVLVVDTIVAVAVNSVDALVVMIVVGAIVVVVLVESLDISI